MILWAQCSEPFKSLLRASGLDNGKLCIPIPLVIINMMPWICLLKGMDPWMRWITWLISVGWVNSRVTSKCLETGRLLWLVTGRGLRSSESGDLLQGSCHLIQKGMSRPGQMIFANIQRILGSSFGSGMLRLGWTQHSGGARPGPVLLLPSARAHAKLWAEIVKLNYKHGRFLANEWEGLGEI